MLVALLLFFAEQVTFNMFGIDAVHGDKGRRREI